MKKIKSTKTILKKKEEKSSRKKEKKPCSKHCSNP
jgi:hypothetical protein